MKTKIILLAFTLSVGASSVIHSQTLDISIKNLKSSKKGIVRLAFFADEYGFKNEKPVFTMEYSKNSVTDGQLSVSVPVKAGKYAICALDDENESGKLEYNFLGIPKEGFGFSNFYLTKLSKPKFNDFSFFIGDLESKTISLKMKYLL